MGEIMAKRYKKKNNLYLLFIVLVILVGIFLMFYNEKIYNKNTTVKSEDKEEIDKSKDEKKIENRKKISDTTNKSDNSNNKNPNEDINNITPKPSNDEVTETKNEEQRKGGTIKLELIGESNITIKKGNKYVDQGVKAYYENGEDASDLISVDNDVDTSKVGSYTVAYYYGNSVVIRRITVEE